MYFLRWIVGFFTFLENEGEGEAETKTAKSEFKMLLMIGKPINYRFSLEHCHKSLIIKVRKFYQKNL